MISRYYKKGPQVSSSVPKYHQVSPSVIKCPQVSLDVLTCPQASTNCPRKLSSDHNNTFIIAKLWLIKYIAGVWVCITLYNTTQYGIHYYGIINNLKMQASGIGIDKSWAVNLLSHFIGAEPPIVMTPSRPCEQERHLSSSLRLYCTCTGNHLSLKILSFISKLDKIVRDCQLIWPHSVIWRTLSAFVLYCPIKYKTIHLSNLQN